MSQLIRYLILFDKEDVINHIRDATVQGRPARCVHFTSNFGAKSKKDGEVCYDRAAGMLLHFQFGGQVIDNTNWTEIGGAWLPTHVEETEDGRRVITIDQTFTLVESFPPDTFTLPPRVPPYQWCSDWRRPTGSACNNPRPDQATTLMTSWCKAE
jgi:hypothetical protein